MSLPKIQSYVLPRPEELPAPRVSWQPDSSRLALLVHDMQNYFVRAFPAGDAPIAPVIANIAALRQACDDAGIPVFYTAQPGNQDPRDRGLQREFWGPGMTDAPEHQSIVDALTPLPHHIVLTKWRYSAFQRTNLEPMLRARGRTQLIVCGVYAHIGCLLSTADAFMHDIEPFYVADAVADFSRERHDFAVDYASTRCAVVTDTASLIAALSAEIAA